MSILCYLSLTATSILTMALSKHRAFGSANLLILPPEHLCTLQILCILQTLGIGGTERAVCVDTMVSWVLHWS